MLSTDTLLQIFLNASIIVPNDDDGVFLGTMQIQDCEVGFDAVMAAHCEYIDTLLAIASLSDYDYMSLLLLRGFQYSEYLLLHDKSIQPADFKRYKIFSTLLICTNKDRKLFTHVTPSRHAYNNCLAASLKVHNPYLHNFLYEV